MFPERSLWWLWGRDSWGKSGIRADGRLWDIPGERLQWLQWQELGLGWWEADGRGLGFGVEPLGFADMGEWSKKEPRKTTGHMEVPLTQDQEDSGRAKWREGKGGKSLFCLGFTQFKMPIWHSRRNVRYVAEKIRARDKMWEREKERLELCMATYNQPSQASVAQTMTRLISLPLSCHLEGACQGCYGAPQCHQGPRHLSSCFITLSMWLLSSRPSMV